MLKQVKPDLEDLSRHAVREELRRIADAYRRDCDFDDNNGSNRDGRCVDLSDVDTLVYTDPALVALRERLNA